MFIGIILILAGILIAIYPLLLSIIVATLLISIGLTFMLISYRFKRMHKHFSDPFADFFLRY